MNVSGSERTGRVAEARASPIATSIRAAGRASAGTSIPFSKSAGSSTWQTFGVTYPPAVARSGRLSAQSRWRAGRCLAAEWRPARLRPGVHARHSTSTRQRRVRDAEPARRGGHGGAQPDFAAALARATNDWQVEEWVRKEPRLRRRIVIPYEDAALPRRGDRALRGRQRLRAGPAAEPRARSRWAGSATGRSTRRRRRQTCRGRAPVRQRRLAEHRAAAGAAIILRSTWSATPSAADAASQPGPRRRVRGFRT